MTSDRNKIAALFGKLACEAGSAIMRVRAAGAITSHKGDGSPVTQADLDADYCIRTGLAEALPGIVVVTEEAAETHADEGVRQFILVDPLDGTREFVAGRDEFTVNIALIDSGLPVAGAIFAPALRQLYVAGEGAWCAEVPPLADVPPLEAMQRIAAAAVPETHWRAVASRSHLDDATKQWLESKPIGEFCGAGSSLKFCTIAEGRADVYPRLSTTMQWDTAAGHAVLRAAGGSVDTLDGKPLRYGRHEGGFKNPSFVAWGRR